MPPRKVVVGQVRPGISSCPWKRRGKRANSLAQSSSPRSTTMERASWDITTVGAP